MGIGVLLIPFYCVRDGDGECEQCAYDDFLIGKFNYFDNFLAHNHFVERCRFNRFRREHDELLRE